MKRFFSVSPPTRSHRYADGPSGGLERDSDLFQQPNRLYVGLIFLALTGFFFTQHLGDPFPEATLVPFFDGAIIMFILLAPALTMRLLAEESKLGTIELLLTSPVRDWEIIVGKYIAKLDLLPCFWGFIIFLRHPIIRLC
ncbi:MAG: hypothetical protein CM1200mP27_02910 [Chloroflexota bacterium]|nr:MAG: hypothetical protein CM1200mP27_02910 [Chloroflexota bacterium]